MNIALDFDDTFTAAPDMWKRFIHDADTLGHQVWIVTARRDTAENREIICKALGRHEDYVGITFANLKSKLKHCESIGLRINIWIDDSPYAIIHDM